MLNSVPTLRIFISSPGDVAVERQITREVIENLGSKPAFAGRVSCQPVAWDNPGISTPLLATVTPQEAINQGLAKPSDCDITVVILWSRMGTPFTLAEREYLSGTHWEYEDAIESDKTEVIVYRRTEIPMVGLDDPMLDQKREQYQRVGVFFEQLQQGEVGYNHYSTPEEFRNLFESHLESLAHQLLSRKESPDIPTQVVFAGPLDNRDFEDDTVQRVVDHLRENHRQLQDELLPLSNLIPELDELFNRKTFRNESVAACREQSWDKRLHSALQTLEVLKAYQRNVRMEGTNEQYMTYRELLAEIDRYSHELAVTMFEPVVETSRLLSYVGAEAFYTQLATVAERRKISKRTDSDHLLDVPESIDQHRERAIALFDRLAAPFM